MSECFLNEERACDAECMAFGTVPAVRGAKPTCLIIDSLVKLAAQFNRTPVVQHPQSAPPPKVNT